VSEFELLKPAWSLPADVQAVVTTRAGGVSNAAWSEFNLASHVGDDPGAVAANRRKLIRELIRKLIRKLDSEPVWLNQVHGDQLYIVNESDGHPAVIEADASYTRLPGIALAILVADCLPILICSSDGREIAAVHAGWRGLANGIIANAVQSFESRELTAWLGPAIGPCHYEVDEKVRSCFDSDTGFTVVDATHWMFDLAAVARQQLQKSGVDQIQASSICTACDSRFYSFRRDGETGRFAAVIWRHQDA